MNFHINSMYAFHNYLSCAYDSSNLYFCMNFFRWPLKSFTSAINASQTEAVWLYQCKLHRCKETSLYVQDLYIKIWLWHSLNAVNKIIMIELLRSVRNLIIEYQFHENQLYTNIQRCALNSISAFCRLLKHLLTRELNYLLQ